MKTTTISPKVDSSQVTAIANILKTAHKFLIIQADNPDADSLGSAVALEALLAALGKDVYSYSATGVPAYLHYIDGWNRVNTDLPSAFDATIIVDTATITLLERLKIPANFQMLAKKPCIVIDHHANTSSDIPFATVTINDPAASSTGELLYRIAQTLQWPVNAEAANAIMAAILGDTQGLTNISATAHTYKIMAELIEIGANRPRLEELRREMSKMDPRVFKYKATLIQRTELFANDRLALVTIPQEEINQFSPLYNPAPLIQQDMLQINSVQIALVLKKYETGRVLGSIRCNPRAPIASDLAAAFGGGGHPYAAGFKLTDVSSFDETVQQCVKIATELLNKIADQEEIHETIRYTF